VVGAEGYLADEKDFRSAIVRLRGANPDMIALIAYYPTAHSSRARFARPASRCRSSPAARSIRRNSSSSAGTR